MQRKGNCLKEVYIPTLREIIDSSAEKYGDKPFIKFVRNDETVEKSYADLRRDVLALCRYLRYTLGGRKHIAVLGSSSYEYIAFILAVIVSGNVAVPLAPEISAKEAAFLADFADANVLVYEPKFENRVDDFKKLSAKNTHLLNIGNTDAFEETVRKFSDDSEYASLSDIEIDKDECCIIVFTSGKRNQRLADLINIALVLRHLFLFSFLQSELRFRAGEPFALLLVVCRCFRHRPCADAQYFAVFTAFRYT